MYVCARVNNNKTRKSSRADDDHRGPYMTSIRARWTDNFSSAGKRNGPAGERPRNAGGTRGDAQE